jgi:CDP-paratose 2-epimerase
MKYLVIGGAGFIGSNLIEKLLELKKNVFVIDNLSRKGTSELQNKLNLKDNYSFFNIDIKDYSKLLNFFKKYNFSKVFLLASQVAVTTSLINPRLDFNSNILGCFNVLEALRNTRAESKVIFSSTNKVYGKLLDLKLNFSKKNGYSLKKYPLGIKESFPVNFVTPYGCSKGAADFYCQDYYKTFNIKTVVMRQSCIYGRMQLGIEDQGWIAWMIIASLLNKPITIYGNGLQVRDALYADDLVDAYLKSSSTNLSNGQIYNIGGGHKSKISILGLIRFLEKKLNKKIKYKFKAERIGDQKVFISDNKKAYQDFNWVPKTNLEKGLSKTIDWIDTNMDFIKNINRI